MIKYGVKLVLWKADANGRGQLPVYLCITIRRIRRYIATGIFLKEKDWDARAQAVRPSHPLHGQYNPDLQTRQKNVVQYIVERQVAGKDLTADQVKAHFGARANLHNIFDFIDDYIEECRNKKEASTLENYRKHALRLEQFHGSRELTFEEITPEFLRRYEKHLREPAEDGLKPVGNNYIHALWTTLRTFFNAAQKRKIITCYPFDQYENPIYEGPIKEYLSVAELKRMEKFAMKTRDPILRQTAIYFLLGCYTGLRISDWYRFDFKKNIVEGRLRLRAKKNGEWVTMPIMGPLIRVLHLVQEVQLISDEPVLNRSLKKIAAQLGIFKRLTTHSGRHTFAISICADRGISAETCAELMGITITTCVENYYRVSNLKIDREASKAWKGL